MPRREKLHYAWVVAGVTFLTLLVAAGLRATPSVLIVPLETEFGWSRATISFAIGVNIFLYGLIGPFAAAAMDRFGLRRTMLGALACIAVGVILTPLMTRPWQLVLLWGVIVGTGSGATALVLGATVVARWFSARRGLVVGILTASTATGQLVFLPALASLAQNYGWRIVSLTVAAVALALLPLVALLMRDRPEDLGLRPYGAPADEKPAIRNRGNRWRPRFERYETGCVRATFGYSPVASSFAVLQRMASSGPISSPLASIMASRRWQEPACWRQWGYSTWPGRHCRAGSATVGATVDYSRGIMRCAGFP